MNSDNNHKNNNKNNKITKIKPGKDSTQKIMHALTRNNISDNDIMNVVRQQFNEHKQQQSPLDSNQNKTKSTDLNKTQLNTEQTNFDELALKNYTKEELLKDAAKAIPDRNTILFIRPYDNQYSIGQVITHHPLLQRYHVQEEITAMGGDRLITTYFQWMLPLECLFKAPDKQRELEIIYNIKSPEIKFGPEDDFLMHILKFADAYKPYIYVNTNRRSSPNQSDNFEKIIVITDSKRCKRYLSYNNSNKYKFSGPEEIVIAFSFRSGKLLLANKANIKDRLFSIDHLPNKTEFNKINENDISNQVIRGTEYFTKHAVFVPTELVRVGR